MQQNHVHHVLVGNTKKKHLILLSLNAPTSVVLVNTLISKEQYRTAVVNYAAKVNGPIKQVEFQKMIVQNVLLDGIQLKKVKDLLQHVILNVVLENGPMKLVLMLLMIANYAAEDDGPLKQAWLPTINVPLVKVVVTRLLEKHKH